MVKLMARDNYASMLRVRLAANGGGLEWVSRDRAGRETVYADEPDAGWGTHLKLWFLSLFTSEDLL